MLSKLTKLCDLVVDKMALYQHYETVDNVIRFSNRLLIIIFFVLVKCYGLSTQYVKSKDGLNDGREVYNTK